MTNGTDKKWLNKVTLTIDPRNNNKYVADGEKEESRVTLSVSQLSRLVSKFHKLKFGNFSEN